MNDVIDIVVMDGNRTASWVAPKEKTVAEILRRWRRGYRQFDPDNVRMNGRIVPQEVFACKIGDFTGGGKAVFTVHSVKKGGV